MQSSRAAVVVVASAVGITFAALAASDAVSPLSGGIGTIVTLDSFDPAPVKPPKVLLVPQEGSLQTKPVKLKLLDFTDVRIDALVVKGLAGDYDVEIDYRDAGVASFTMPDTFSILVPEPASVEPATGPVKIPVIVHGSRFGDRKGKVTIGGKNAKVTAWADDGISVVVPRRLEAGEHAVVVTNRAGQSTAVVSFTVAAAPVGGAARYFRYDEDQNHFNASEEDTLYYTGSSYNVSQDFFGVGASGKPAGLPGIVLAVNGPDFATPTPFTVTTVPTAVGTLTVTYSNYSSVFTALPGSGFTLTVTSYAEGVVGGTFSGTLTKLAGTGPASVAIANGAFRATVHVTGQ